MKDGPAFQMYAADLYVDTNSWTTHELGVYTRLLMSEWVNGPLPDDAVKLSRISGCSIKKFLKAWPVVREKFQNSSFLESKSGSSIEIDNPLSGTPQLINPRLEGEREKQRKYKELQSQKGKMSAQSRFNRGSTEPITEPQPDGQPKVNSSSSSSYIKKYYKDDKFNYVCKTCGKLYQEWNNFQNHKCKEEDNERT